MEAEAMSSWSSRRISQEVVVKTLHTTRRTSVPKKRARVSSKLSILALRQPMADETCQLAQEETLSWRLPHRHARSPWSRSRSRRIRARRARPREAVPAPGPRVAVPIRAGDEVRSVRTTTRRRRSASRPGDPAVSCWARAAGCDRPRPDPPRRRERLAGVSRVTLAALDRGRGGSIPTPTPALCRHRNLGTRRGPGRNGTPSSATARYR